MTPREALPGTLNEWVNFLSDLNPDHIELGLERVRTVLLRLKLDNLKNIPVIEFAGTNGKGSTAALVAATLDEAGIACGLYTSPHLHRFNERVRINGHDIDDVMLCDALSAVYEAANAQSPVSLTYFEYTTLAALWCFNAAKVRAMCLEIGLGGRLDAVNVIDADIAVIVSIGFDHMAILGNTLSKIAYEKVGIIKKGSVTITGELPPEAAAVVKSRCSELESPLFSQGEDFWFEKNGDGFCYRDKQKNVQNFPSPLVPVECAAVASAVISKLAGLKKLPESTELFMAERRVISRVCLPGRMQRVHQCPDVYFDVAHNVPAAEHLKKALLSRPKPKRRLAVVGMLRDKDIEGVLGILCGCFDAFYTATLHSGRGENAQRLQDALIKSGCRPSLVKSYDSVSSALKACVDEATPCDEIVVFGSFVTVSEASDCASEIFCRG